MTYDIPPHRRGDTWDGINSISISVNNVPISLSGASIAMDFRQGIDTPVIMRFTTENNTIQILNANTIRIPSRKIEVPFGTYQYDLQVTYPTGVVKTYMSGIWPIVPDVTV
jgi:hypothetical protein